MNHNKEESKGCNFLEGFGSQPREYSKASGCRGNADMSRDIIFEFPKMRGYVILGSL